MSQKRTGLVNDQTPSLGSGDKVENSMQMRLLVSGCGNVRFVMTLLFSLTFIYPGSLSCELAEISCTVPSMGRRGSTSFTGNGMDS